MSSRLSGKVNWFNDIKGFGFITPDDGTEEIFVHQSQIKTDGFRSLAPGESVEYQVEYGSDGRPKAVQVTGPGGAAVQGSERSRDSGGGDGYGGSGRGGGRSGGAGDANQGHDP
ncbi:unnamed protein product [Vicia faba]|uniref:CSD domain-containing protein n=1 Tax=Vicia faba TaxID=3906 RepID=A0AAV1APY1_VICFA|nr:unnamed protein product [Vicia faba]